jgi:hypothetical protein
MENVITLQDVHADLVRPFDVEYVELKPGAVAKDKTKALALAYVDARAYHDRLDAACGPEGWSVEYRPLPSGAGLICRLTILGVVREDVGESPQNDPNAATSAAMQAFKRACAAFGLGRYLYRLPQPWADYDEQSKRFARPAEVARDIYRKAGLLADTRANGYGRH